MAIETWYRGEGVNIPPAKPGKVKHDFADGVYLADTLDGAKPFARRAPDAADQRLYQVKVDLGSMKVLNLSTDKRWENYMKEPLSPVARGLSRGDFLKQMPSAEHYNGFFTAFVKVNKIDLNQYDAVVGPLLQHGGNQMCVLHKNGQPSALAGKLRAQFVPVGTGPIPATPPGRLWFGGRIGPGMKVAGGAIIGIAVRFLLGWLVGKSVGKIMEDEIQRQFAALRPEIERDIRAKKEEALWLVSGGAKAFAVVRMETTTFTDVTGSQDPGTPRLSYVSLQVSDTEINGPDGSKRDSSIPGVLIDKDYFNMSFALTFSDEEVKLYRAYVQEMQWYDAQILSAPSAQDERRLSRERDGLMQKMKAAMAE